MRKAVEFLIDEPVRLVNGGTAKPGRIYKLPVKMLEREPTPWREPHELAPPSRIGTRIHKLLSAVGLQPAGGCKCRSIAKRLDRLKLEQINVQETAELICGSVQRHRKVSYRQIGKQLLGCVSLVCIKLVPSRILPLLARCLIRMAIYGEKRSGRVQVRKTRTLFLASDGRRSGRSERVQEGHKAISS
jgi:hypothetical protein